MTNLSTPTFRKVGDCSPNPFKIDAPVLVTKSLIRC